MSPARPLPSSPTGTQVLRRSPRDRALLWVRPWLAAIAAGTIVATGSSSWHEAALVGATAAGLTLLGDGRLHRVLKSRAVAAAALRARVTQSPGLTYLIPFPGVAAVIEVESRSVSWTDTTLVIAGAVLFTWAAWEAAIRLALRSTLVHRLLTHWEVKARQRQLQTVAAAESRWRDQTW